MHNGQEVIELKNNTEKKKKKEPKNNYVWQLLNARNLPFNC